MNEPRFRSAILLLLLISLALGGRQTAASAPAPPFAPGQLLVKFEADVSVSAAADLPARYGAQWLRNVYQRDVELWQVPSGQELALVERLNADPLVAYAEPNYLYRVRVEPDDAGWGTQWAPPHVNLPAAWDLSTGNGDLVIAIIDTGVDETHPDLAGKLVAGYDFVDDDATPHDLHGHGTHCAGIAAAATNNGLGIAGVDWMARLMPVRALGEEGYGSSSDITEGITWASEQGADVLSLSLGSTGYSQTMQDAIDDAHAAGTLVVAAMGNDRQDGNPTNYPAAYDNVIAVAATDPNDVYTPYSQYGPHCDVAAPGGVMESLHDPDGIYSTMPTYPVFLTTQYGYATDYDQLKGTSQATPHVAGLASLIWALNPDLTPDQVQAIIESTAVDLGSPGWDQDYGHGRIDAGAALAAVPPPLPDRPVLFPIDNGDGDGSYLVDWGEAAYASTYTLQEDDDPAFASPTTRYTGPDSQIYVANQPAGIWHYRVRAANPSGESTWSAPQSVEVPLTLSVWPTEVHFVIKAGRSLRLPRTVHVESNGPPLTWTAVISPNVGWLGGTPLTGTTPGEIDLVAEASGSSTLFLQTALIVSATEPVSGSPQIIPITLSVVQDLPNAYLPIVRH